MQRTSHISQKDESLCPHHQHKHLQQTTQISKYNKSSDCPFITTIPCTFQNNIFLFHFPSPDESRSKLVKLSYKKMPTLHLKGILRRFFSSKLLFHKTKVKWHTKCVNINFLQSQDALFPQPNSAEFVRRG